MSLPPEPNPHASPRAPSAWQVNSIAAVWSLVSAFAGGLLCGWLIDRYGELGALLSLAACGAFAGYVFRKITQVPSKVAGLCLAVAACLMFFIAETCWIHWNMPDGDVSWRAALGLWPRFIEKFELSALIGAASAGYGAWCAYGYATSPSPPPIQPATPAAPPPSSSTP